MAADPSISEPATAAKPKHDSRTATGYSLLFLPLELQLLIASNLPYPAYLALRLTHPYLYHALASTRNPVPLQELDQCARIAVRTYLMPYLSGSSAGSRQQGIQQADSRKCEPDATTATTQKQHTIPIEPRMIRCALCGNMYPERMFKSASSPACAAQDLGAPRMQYPEQQQQQRQNSMFETTTTSRHHPRHRDGREWPSANMDAGATKRRGDPDWDVVELPMRVCCWHVGRLARMVRVDPRAVENTRDNTAPGTLNAGTAAAAAAITRRQDTATAHQGLRRREYPLTWVSRMEQMCMHCGAIQAWRRCRCACQTCGVRPARTYTRYYADEGWSCAGFVFWRDQNGNLWVRETVRNNAPDGSNPTTSSIDKPVVFE